VIIQLSWSNGWDSGRVQVFNPCPDLLFLMRWVEDMSSSENTQHNGRKLFTRVDSTVQHTADPAPQFNQLHNSTTNRRSNPRLYSNVLSNRLGPVTSTDNMVDGRVSVHHAWRWSHRLPVHLHWYGVWMWVLFNDSARSFTATLTWQVHCRTDRTQGKEQGHCVLVMIPHLVSSVIIKYHRPEIKHIDLDWQKSPVFNSDED